MTMFVGPHPRVAEWQAFMRRDLAAILHRHTAWQINVPEDGRPFIWVIDDNDVGYKITIECLAIYPSYYMAPEDR